MTENQQDTYGLYDEGRLVGTFFAPNDRIAIRDAAALGYEPCEVRVLRDGKWCEVTL
jgi:hypothetical protein